MEAMLNREREFNSESRKFNVEYLVNVLRKFLLSCEAAERANLVPVICAILQFRPDESKAIALKWAPPTKQKGLVGWLMPAQPVQANTPSTSTDNESLRNTKSATSTEVSTGPNGTNSNGQEGLVGKGYNPYNDAIGGLDIY